MLPPPGRPGVQSCHYLFIFYPPPVIIPIMTTNQSSTSKYAAPTTPAMKQYVEQKKQVPDAILFFRMGDFYEMFYDDAKTASRVLGLALTSRSKGSANPVPLAGIPYHAMDSYLSRMVKAGYKVAISEQVEDPKEAKGVVKREIVRVVTPGTLTENILLEERKGNYLASCCIGQEQAGLAWVELSTGEFRTLNTNPEYLIDELVRIGASELLLPETDSAKQATVSAKLRKLAQTFTEITEAAVTYRPGWWFEKFHAEFKLTDQFKTLSLEGFGFREFEPSLCSAGAILEYLSETQKTALDHIRNIQRVENGKYLQLDQTTIRSLELQRTMRSDSREGSLLGVIDQTTNAMGARLLRQWIFFPLCDIGEIMLRQDAVDLLMQNPGLLRQIRAELKTIIDLERIVSRIGTARTTPRDMSALRETLQKLPKIIDIIEPLKIPGSLLESVAGNMGDLDDLANYLKRAIDDDPPPTLRDCGVIASGFDDQLDQLRAIKSDGQSWLAEFQARESRRTNIPKLKVGFNRVFGYYIEITNTQKQSVPPEYIRKQTLKNAERYITEELKNYEQQQLTAEERAAELEAKLFEQVRIYAAKYIDELQKTASALATLDLLASFAHTAKIRGYVRPEIISGHTLKIKDGRHPVLDVMLSEKFVPNDVNLSPTNAEMMIITGPNMAGKSTYIRQSALLVLLAHTGSFIPAKQATIGICDRIFTRIGASDELTRGQSTFMVEMTEAANILNNATQNSLIILDEIGRGTSTYDGLSLAWAIVEYITKNIHARTLFATHYHELTELENLLPNVKNFNVLVREWHDQIIFLHKISEGGTDKSYGIHVARLAGLPPKVITRSRIILSELEQNFSREAKLQLPELTKKQHQTDLFDLPENSVIDEIREIDTEKITPLQAIQILDDMKNRLKK